MTRILKNPLVSYLISAYNEEKFIEQNLNSILAQSYNSIEIVFVDDGSKDKTYEKAKSILLNQKRFNYKLSKFNSNKGKCTAYNEAFKISSGDIITIIGADDIADPLRTDYIIDRMIRDHSLISYGNIRHFSKLDNFKFLKITNYKKNNLYFYNSIPGPSIFIDRNLANQIFPIPEYIPAEDWYITTTAIKLGHTPKYINYNVTYYRVHENNDSSIGRYDERNFERQLRRELKVLKAFSQEKVHRNSKKRINQSIKYRKLIIEFLSSSFIRRSFIFCKIFLTPLRKYMILALLILIKKRK